MSEIIPDKWTKIKLGKLIEHFQNGYAFTSSRYKNEGIPIISIVNISLDGNFKFDTTKENKWSREELTFLEKYKVVNGDLIIAMTDVTPTMEILGRGAIVNRNEVMLLNQRVGLIKTKQDVIKRYLSYLFNSNSWRNYCKTSAGLGAQANLGTKEILNANILVPTLPEQKKIASILTSVDEIIEKTQSQINRLQDLKKGMINKLLIKGIGHTEFKDSELGKIPNNWDIQKLGDLCEIRGRIGWKGYAVADLRNEGALVIGATQINKNHEIDLSKPKYISDKKYEESPEIMIQPNDIILVKTGNTIGKLALVSNDIGRATINPNTVILRSKSNFHEFIYFVLTWSVYQSKFWDLVAVGAQPSLNQENIKNILLSLPNQDEMKIINKTLKKHINLINNLKIKKDKLQLLKKSLMQDLLTGKVRVSVN